MHSYRISFLLKIREIFIFNIMFTAFIKILPVGELPSHNHSASTNTTGEHSHSVQCNAPHNDPVWSNGNILGRAETKYGINSYTTSTNGNHSHSITISNTGSNQSHNIMQPYIAVYMWKRKS